MSANPAITPTKSSRSDTPTSGFGLGWLEGTIDAMLSGLSPTAIDTSKADVPPSPSLPDSQSQAEALDSIEVPLDEPSSSQTETTVQGVVRDLKASNSRLAAQSAALEAVYSKQLELVASQLRDIQSQLEQKNQGIAVLEARCQAGEARLREKEEALQQLREEASVYRRQQSMASLYDDAKKEEKVDSYSLANQLESTQDALVRSESALSQVQNEQRERLEEHSRTLVQLDESRQTIISLQSQVLELSTQSSKNPNQLPYSEADEEANATSLILQLENLRLVNQSQEEELLLLRVKLEEAVQELEAREIETQQNQSQAVKDLMEARQTICRLEQDLQMEIQKRERAPSPLVRMAALDSDDDEDEKLTEAQVKRICELESLVQTAQMELSLANTNLRQLADEKEQIVQSHQMQLRHCQQASANSEASLRDQLAATQAELLGLQRQRSEETPSQQSRGLSGDDSHPKTEMPRPDGTLAQQCMAQDAYKQQVKDLQNKLEDRDTTISALVKSSVGLEQQLASVSMESEELRRKLSASAVETGLDVIVTESVSKDQLEEVKDALEKCRLNENLLLDELDRLRRQMQDAKVETTQLRSRLEASKSENLLLRSQLEGDNDCGSIANSSIVSSSPQIQIQERDAAIANLVQQSIEQDRLVSDLQTRLATMQQQMESLRTRPSSSPRSVDVATWEEMQELRRETEMFAGQVIEQDEEIESLTKTLHAKEKQLAALESQVEELRANQSLRSSPDDIAKIDRLSGEVDELTEANNVLRDEVRMLRRKAKDMETSAQEIDRLKQEIQLKSKASEESGKRADVLSKEKAELERELRDARAIADNEAKSRIDSVQREYSEIIRKLEAQVKESDRTIVGLRAASSMSRNTVDDFEVENLRSEIVSLQRNLQHQTAAVEKAKGTIRELEHMLAERNANALAAWEEEKEELLSEIESLAQQLDEARQELNQLEQQRVIIEDFKCKLEAADEAREQSEKSIVDNYERKLSLLKLDKDVTIDKLRKDLAEAKELHDTDLEARAAEIQRFKEQVSQLQHEMAHEIQERESQIFALERTLEAQEQLVNNMKSEMDILQGSMENRTVTRREEIEIMQQELVDLTTLAAQQDRDIRALQGKLQDQKLEYESQIATLKETIALMESEEEADHRTAADLKMEIRVREVKDRLEKLKWRNTSLSEENEVLRERLQRAEEQGSKTNEKAEERSKELSRLLAERELKLQMIEAELKELKLLTSTTQDAGPEPKGSRSPMCSPIPPTGKTISARRLGFLARRASSAKRPSQS